MLAVIAGLWCATLATLILLSFALALNLAFEGHAVSWLHEPFVASGMSDAGAFVVRNSLEATSEILTRGPIAALVLSYIGCLLNVGMMARSRIFAIFAAWFTPLMFVGGAFALWYAESLQRSARPPFVLAGVLTAGIALCSVHPIWSALCRQRNIEHG
jgi:hypothetical protein